MEKNDLILVLFCLNLSGGRMKAIFRSTLLLFLVFSNLTGCSLPRRDSFTPTVPPVPNEAPGITPDLNSTVNAAVSATEAAKNAMQSTIDSSVAKTVTAIPPRPTPTIMNVSTVSEEEISALVEKEVDEAMQASIACASTTSAATSDDTVTAEELAEIEAAINATNTAIQEAYDMADQYMALYSEVSQEMVTALQQMETELAALSQSTAEIAGTLDEINSALQQGLALAETTITELEDQAAQMNMKAEEIITKIGDWKMKVSQGMEDRAIQLAGMQPDQVATDRQGTVNQLTEYISQLKASVADGKLSSAELLDIGKTGANLSASLKQFGETGTALAGRIDGLTGLFARGDMPQALGGIKDIESNMGNIGGSLRDFSAPSLPKPPSRK
jgi:hypothetical protein